MNFNELFHYTADSGVLTWKVRKSKRVKIGDMAGCDNGRGYLRVSIDGRLYLAHRIIWEMNNGPIPHGMEIDHINSIKTDNRMENLRLVTRSGNGKNQKRHSTNNSGVTGVCWHKASGKWMAFIHDKKKKRYLGCFDLLDNAIAARARAEKSLSFHELHGRK